MLDSTRGCSSASLRSMLHGSARCVSTAVEHALKTALATAARHPLFKWRVLVAEGTVRLISQGVTSSSTTLRLLWKRVSARSHRRLSRPLSIASLTNLCPLVQVGQSGSSHCRGPSASHATCAMWAITQAKKRAPKSFLKHGRSLCMLCTRAETADTQ